jgi:diaminopimelate decarboxylase
MHSFRYKQHRLFCEDVDLNAIADAVGTPAYVYSAETIRTNFRRLDRALAGLDHSICYAMKANSNLSILHLLASEGADFDIVSGGELFRVLEAGGRAPRVTFAGVGKTRAEIEFALREGIYAFNVESEAEMAFIDEVARALGVKAPISLRVNPDVDAGTHKYISTGKSQNKFGIGLGLRAGRRLAQPSYSRHPDAHRLADSRREALRRSRRKARAHRRAIEECASNHRILQHRRRHRHRLRPRAGKRRS